MDGGAMELGAPVPGAGAEVTLSVEALQRLMPMHAIVSRTGHITQAGGTLQKLFAATQAGELAGSGAGTGAGNGAGKVVGRRFLELFELRRPRAVHLIEDLMVPEGVALNLRLRDESGIRLKGLALPLPQRAGLIVNLAFGISVPDAVREFALSAPDFAPTDLAIEMLYLIESKNLLTEESRRLNLRLLGAKSVAEEQAFTDALTGLKNRRALGALLAGYTTSGEPFSLMNLDLDHFKAVNDTLGHAAGDHVLSRVAQILRAETRAEDTIVRLGGDEFVMVFPRLSDRKLLARIGDRLLRRLKKPIIFEGEPCRIAGSIGITRSVDYLKIDPQQMLVDADVALYASKQAGRGRYTFVLDVGGVGQSARGAFAQGTGGAR